MHAYMYSMAIVARTLSFSTMKGEVDGATFDALTSFFNQHDAIETTVLKGATRGGEELLVASEQLLTETEELLALYQHPVNKCNDAVADSSPKSFKEEDKPNVTPKGRLSDDLRQAVRNAQAAKRRHRYRQQLQEERESLKMQETQLSGQLLKLQKVRAQLKAKQAENVAFGAWRAVAVRQLEKRQQAEQRQKLLRKEVAGRARMIHRMNILLQERLQNSETSPNTSLEWMKTNREADGSELVKSMMSDLDTQYARIDEVSRGLEFKTSTPMSHDQTKKWQDGVLHFDSADRMEYPYDFKRVAEVLTTLLMSDDEVSWGSIQVQGIKDTFAMKYRTTYQVSPGTYSSFVVYGASKKYREKDRVVFLCRCFTEGCDEFEGFHSDETLWMVVRPSSESQNSTLLECYSRLIPMHFGSAPSCDENMDKFVKVIAEWSEQESNKMMQLMERLLISK